MKLLQAPNLKTITLTKAMYTAICRNEDQAFNNMGEESGENKQTFDCFIVKKPLRPFPNQVKALLGQKKIWRIKDPNEGERGGRGCMKVSKDAPSSGYN